MNTIVITASTDADLRKALETGTAQVHTQRADGTLRRRHFLSGVSLEHALWIKLQRDGQDAEGDVPAVTPRTMASIAKELNMSVAAVRRVLVDLAITEELLDADQDELDSLLAGAEEDTTVTA